jgi:hypothetical protein
MTYEDCQKEISLYRQSLEDKNIMIRDKEEIITNKQQLLEGRMRETEMY